jgi:L-fuconolactonase
LTTTEPNSAGVIDAHQHFWNLERVSYPYLPTNLEAIYRTFEEPDLEPLLDAAGVDRTVLVQSMDSFADTDYMLEVAGRWDRVAAVVGWVPLFDPDAAALAIDRYRQDRRFAGIRHLIHHEADDNWLIRDDVQHGLALLSDRGLTFDVVATIPAHLALVPTLSARHPALRMVIDHLAMPPIADHGWEPWATQLRVAAENPNVYTKLSGLITAASWTDWTVEDLRPYVDHALEVFGTKRIMYGGDWPISRLGGGYEAAWRAARALLSPLAAPEQAQILGLTATKFYGIDD